MRTEWNSYKPAVNFTIDSQKIFRKISNLRGHVISTGRSPHGQDITAAIRDEPTKQHRIAVHDSEANFAQPFLEPGMKLRQSSCFPSL